jgi:hypothetical protein
MNEEQIKKDMIMSLIKIETLDKKLSIAITGLNAIISNNSDTLNIAQKTLDELKKVDLPQKEL